MSNALPITQGLAGAASAPQAQPQAQAQVSVFGTLDTMFGIWDGVFGTSECVFGVLDAVFGIWDGVCVAPTIPVASSTSPTSEITIRATLLSIAHIC